MVASVRFANGETVNSVIMSNGSSPSPSLGEHMNSKPRVLAMHVTMDDPILRKKIMLRHQHQRAFEPALESMKPSPEAVAAISGPAAGNAASSLILPRKGYGTVVQVLRQSRQKGKIIWVWHSLIFLHLI